MPSKYVVRNLRENAYYHVYNTGPVSSDIFLDIADYETFLYYLFIYTSPPSAVAARYPHLPARLVEKNLHEDILLVAHCLMPNHFHLLLKQKALVALPKLMKQVANGYTTYFNGKYKRAGSLLRGRYKSILVESDYLLIQMIRFVHLNPSISRLCSNPADYAWSSYKNPITTSQIIGRYTTAEWDAFHVDKSSYDLNMPKLRHLMLD